jgi:hypothetical protein
MKRSAIALAASVLALALTAGPASADPGQTVADSTGVAQVGGVALSAPVRVASDGDNGTAGAGEAGPQSTGDSTGAAQVSAVHANAPVRVLSDGNDGSSDGGATAAPEQSVGDSSGAVQVGSLRVDAPARVASDGNEAGAGEPAGVLAGPQAVDGSTGVAQVGSPGVSAPLRVASGDGASDAAPVDDPDVGDAVGDLVGHPTGGDPGDGPVKASPQASPQAGDAPADGGPGLDGPVRRLVDDGGSSADPVAAIELRSGGGTGAPAVKVLGVAAESLPLTGFGFAALAGLGLWLLSSGLALRLVPGGKRR